MVISDTLSRAPIICEQSNQEELSCYETEKFVELVIDSLPATDSRIQKIFNKQSADQVCKILKSYCENGWPERKSDLADFMKSYWSLQGEITINHGLLMKGDQIIIPVSMQDDILSKIHWVHQGITKSQKKYP